MQLAACSLRLAPGSCLLAAASGQVSAPRSGECKNVSLIESRAPRATCCACCFIAAIDLVRSRNALLLLQASPGALPGAREAKLKHDSYTQVALSFFLFSSSSLAKAASKSSQCARRKSPFKLSKFPSRFCSRARSSVTGVAQERSGASLRARSVCCASGRPQQLSRVLSPAPLALN